MISIKAVSKNAHSAIRDNIDFDSNGTEESDPHSEKQSSSKTSTDAGRMISTKTISKNAHSAIRDNLDLDSNVNEESNLQLEKHASHKTSTDAAMVANLRLGF
jgi:hypothetical protein